MKVFIEELYEKEEKGIKVKKWKKKSEEKDLKTAKVKAIKVKAIKQKERIHICYHDEKNPRGCKIL